MDKHHEQKAAIVDASVTFSKACRLYDEEAYGKAMYMALYALEQYADIVASFAGEYPYNEHIWNELLKVSQHVEYLKHETFPSTEGGDK